MIGLIETSTALYFTAAEPNVTSWPSRPAQRRQRLVDVVAPLTGRSTTYGTHYLEDGASTARERVDAGEAPITQADRAIFSLLKLEKLGADWDGAGAERPLSHSIRDAREFIRALAPESAIPRATLHADGHAILFLRNGNRYAELEFLGNKRIGFYARRGAEEWNDEISFVGQELPPGLSDVGFTVGASHRRAAA
jgi:hypothetical protein